MTFWNTLRLAMLVLSMALIGLVLASGSGKHETQASTEAPTSATPPETAPAQASPSASQSGTSNFNM